MSRWILALQPRRGYYRTLVAIANKTHASLGRCSPKRDTAHEHEHSFR
jgi:hypothetical protein